MGLFDKPIFSKANDFLTSGLEDLFAKQSEWQGLNPHLIAKFYALQSVKEDGKRRWIQSKTDLGIVKAPILEGAEMEYNFNWQSPFEQMGTEAKAPALTAMIQSGAMADFYSGFQSSLLGQKAQEAAPQVGDLQGALDSMEGRTGITKLNSTQTFSGMPPVKCTLKLMFRAFQNAEKEVMKPIFQLLQWAVPQELSPNGTLSQILQVADQDMRNDTLSVGKYIDALMPSKSPTVIAMEYKGRIYQPMVIEAISDPITSPTTSGGKYARAEVSLTLASLTAWDKKDIATIFKKG
ncbi:hypothetical protein ACWIUH_01390 [Ursidibacter arcticus]